MTVPIKDDALLAIRSKQVRARLFMNRRAAEGRLVCVRLNLNFQVVGDDGKTYSIQTIHSLKSSSDKFGSVLGYDKAATLRNASFIVHEKARQKIAAGRSKFPMAGVAGYLTQVEPSTEGVAIRFNPKIDEHFVRADDGRAVDSAEEVTIFHNRVYARGKITYREGIASDAAA